MMKKEWMMMMIKMIMIQILLIIPSIDPCWNKKFGSKLPGNVSLLMTKYVYIDVWKMMDNSDDCDVDYGDDGDDDDIDYDDVDDERLWWW